MRIIGGSLRGRRIEAPRGLATRPSSDRLRETLFNVLGPQIEGRSFVDAFAGTGAVGLEAHSRGACPIIWIESAPMAARVLRANLAHLDVAGTVWEKPVLRTLAELEHRGGCDYFFLDPPYDDARAYAATLRALDTRRALLRPGASVIVETRSSTAPLPALRRLQMTRRHPVGDSCLVWLAADK